eukprot:gene11478-biopygen8331
MSTSHRVLSAPIPPPQGAAPLPVPPLLEGIVDFAELRDVGAAYVDNTSTISKLAQRRQRMYLSRPDGFGKSVLLSTLKYYFEGRADLFEGLAVGEAMASRAVAQRPVLHLNMEEMGSSIVNLEHNLTRWLSTHEARYKIQVVPEMDTMEGRLEEIIERAFEESKTAMEAQQGGTPSFPGVVVLIDNFHTPLVKSLGTPEERAVRELYDSLFYSLFQNSQVYFLLATGTLSLDHLRNHLHICAPPNDVSTRPEWSDVCGFSIEEIRETFAAHLEATAARHGVTTEALMSELEQHYKAYVFTWGKGFETVYRPSDVLQMLGGYDEFWIQRASSPPSIALDCADFKTIRRSGAFYVDKTEAILGFIGSSETRASHFSFLGRPRRFGKSLLCSTLQCFCEGRKDLFKGLAISRHEKVWSSYCVLSLSFVERSFASPERGKAPPGPQVETVISSRAVLRVISEAISAFLKRYTNAAGNGAGVTLKGAIDMAWLCTGQQTVVLIDEYDYPLNHCRKGDMKKMKGLYHDFFANIKAAAPHLKVLFVTGIMKFSSVGLFSGGNNVKNASFDEWSATCCGFTELEVRQMLELFPDTPEDITMEELKDNFNGYRFSFVGEELVYNPWSILQTLYNKRIGCDWIGTGNVSDVLLERLKKNETEGFDPVLALAEWLSESVTVREDDLISVCLGPGTFTLNACEMGYLTLKEKLAATNKDSREWKVGCPNKEVRHAVANYVIPMMLKTMKSVGNVRDTYTHPMFDALIDGDWKKFIDLLKGLFAAIYPGQKSAVDLGKIASYTDEEAMKNECQESIWRLEYTYQTILVAVLLVAGTHKGCTVAQEVVVAKGCADIVVTTPKHVYIIELKVGKKTAEKGFEQIMERNYASPYLLEKSREVWGVALELHADKRTIGGYKCEALSRDAAVAQHEETEKN